MILQTIPKLLTNKECKDFIAWGEDGLYQATGLDYPAGYRDNDRLVADRPDLAAQMMTRLKEHLPQQIDWGGTTWTLDQLNPRFRGCRYQNGQSFTRHRDGAHSPNSQTRSFLTVMLYLNDHSEFQGGSTRFFADRYVERQEREVVPKTGLAILFSHDYWHDGQAVTDGVKYVLRTDVMYRADQPQTAGHRGYVWAVDQLPDGRLLSGSRDKTVKVWKRHGSKYRVTQTLTQHSASVTCLTPTSHGFVSGGRDRQLIWWEETASEYRPVHQKQAHAGAVLCLQRQPSTDILSAGADGHLKRWTSRGAPVGDREIGGWAWCLETCRHGFACGMETGLLVLVDFALSRHSTVYQASSPITSLKRRPDGGLYLGTGRGELLILDQTFQLVSCTVGHRGAVTALEITPEGYLISGGEDDGVVLWLESKRRWLPKLLTTHDDFVRALCLTDSGEIVSASYDGTLQTLHYQGNLQSSKPSVIRRTALAANPDGAISGTAAANW